MAFQAGRAPGEWVPAQPAWSPPAIEQRWRLPAGPPGGDGLRRLPVLNVALVGAILLLSVTIGVVISWPTTGSAPGQSATALRTAALQASVHSGWVHVTLLGSTFDVGPGEGSQVISSEDQGNADIVFLGGIAYLRADATFLVNSLALPSAVATEAANRWLSFEAGDPDFVQVAGGLTVGSMMAEAIPSGPVRIVGQTTMDGQQVVGLAGVQNVLGNTSASLTAWVAAAAPHRIVASVVRARNSGLSVTTTVRFSRWGEPVTLSPPAGAVPFVSIGGATPVSS